MFFSKKLKEFENIRHCFFSRKNGFSKGHYKSLNCGTGSNDKKENVLKNLETVSQKIGCKKESLITLNQNRIALSRKGLFLADSVILKFLAWKGTFIWLFWLFVVAFNLILLLVIYLLNLSSNNSSIVNLLNWRGFSKFWSSCSGTNVNNII